MTTRPSETDQGNRFCKACGTPAEDGRLCSHCGAVLELPEEAGLVEDEGQRYGATSKAVRISGGSGA